MSKRDCYCEIELNERDGKWSWGMSVWNPSAIVEGENTYASSATAKRAVLRVARQWGIRVESCHVYGEEIDD